MSNRFYNHINQERKARFERMKQVSQPRKLEEIRQEYAQVCAQIGEAHFNKVLIEQAINAGYQRISELNKESEKAQKKEPSAPKIELSTPEELKVPPQEVASEASPS